jgi:hypothetical protein
MVQARVPGLIERVHGPSDCSNFQPRDAHKHAATDDDAMSALAVRSVSVLVPVLGLLSVYLALQFSIKIPIQPWRVTKAY